MASSALILHSVLRILLVTLFCVSTPYIALHFYNFPSADDFSYAESGISHGFIGAQKFVYEAWSGRYFSTAVMTFNPVSWRWLNGYGLASLLNHLFLIFSVVVFTRSLFSFLKLRHWKIICCGILIILLSHFRSTAQGIYWLAGYVNYTLPMSLLLLALSLYLPIWHQKYCAHWRSLLIALFLFMVIGANEIIMFQLAVVLGLFTLSLIYKKGPFLFQHIFWTVICALGSLIVILAPGNKVRASNFDQPNPLIAAVKSFGITLEHYVQFLSLPLIVGFLLLAKWVFLNSQDWQHSLFKMKRRKVLGLSVLLIALGFFPPLVSMGGQPQPRADNMFYIMYLYAAFILAVQTGLNPPNFLHKISLKRLTVAFVICSLLWVNNIKALRDLIFLAQPYAQFCNEMYATAEANKGKDLVLEDIKTEYPKTVFFDQISKDPKDWKNIAFSSYFSLKSVRLK